jgi:flagellar M-ring protein FliF
MAPGQRIMLIGTVAAILIAIVVGGLILSRAGYSTLYSGLTPEEAGHVVDKLDQRGIPYRIAGGGSTILVPGNKVYSARIELASEGLPRSGTVGFEIFDKTVFGMTEFLQKVNYRRALEGELAQTIAQMEEVEGVRVHIVVPEHTLFKDDEEMATASVVIKTNPARSITRNRIEGIAYLVASAVEGLEPERVTILDSRGTLLTKGSSMDRGQPGDGLELRKSVEGYLEEKAQTLLDGVLGHGKSVVRISAELDLERIERSTERYDPDRAVIRSEERTESTDGDNGGRSEVSVTNYELDRTVESIAAEVGNVERLSVAVMVDGTYQVETDRRGETTRTFIPRTEEELGKIAGIVKSAVGFDLKRNDYFEIASIAFDRTYLEEQQEGMDKVMKMQFYMSIARKAAYLGGVIFGLLLILKLIKKAGGIIGAASRRGAAVRPGAEAEAFIIEEEVPSPANQMAAQIANMAARNPDRAAGVLSSMVGEKE